MRIQELSPKKLAVLAQLLRKEGLDTSQLPIVPLDRDGGSRPLSFAQEQLWILHRLDPESPAYNVHVALPLDGTHSRELIERSLREVIRRHEVLRTTYPAVEGRPVQIVQSGSGFELAFADLTSFAPRDKQSRFEMLSRQAARTPFNLLKGPVVRATLVRLSAGEQVMLLTLHHIVTDGWSMGVLLRELDALTRAYSAGGESPLPEIGVQYADYAAWQRALLTESALKRALGYWKKQLDGVTALELPTDRKRPAACSFEGGAESIVIGHELTDALRGLSRRAGVTLFTTLLSTFNVLLRAYSGQTDMVVGVPVAGRDRLEVQPLIGYFVNMLALRTRIDGSATFLQLLGRVHAGLSEAFAHQELPFERLVAELAPERDLGRNPIFQVVFGLLEAQTALNHHVEPSAHAAGIPSTETTRFDLEVHVFERPDGLSVRLAYSTDLFDHATIRRLAGHYLRLLEGVTTDPEREIEALPLIDADERMDLVAGWNDTRKAYPQAASLATLFEAQVAARPSAVALEWRETQVTYRELNARANQVAHALRRAGVGVDARVGVYLERGVDLLVALVGVAKAGAAYVAMAPADPPGRVAALLADAGVAVIVTSGEPLPADLAGLRVVDVTASAAESSTNPAVAVPSDALAYVAFTSGSTGRPKGVAVPQRAVVRLVHAQSFVTLGPEETLLQLAPVSFDASTLEIWGALLHGSRLVIYPERVPDPAELGAVLRRGGVTTLWLTASLFNAVIDQTPESLASVRQLVVGGEALSVAHVRRAFAALPSTTLVNGYGPTENTTFTCCYRIPRETDASAVSVPLGGPIANTQVYVLDAAGAPVPVGVPGELYAGGDGLARAYVAAPRLTASRFVPDAVSGAAGARLYRTGDIVRWRPDGTLEFLGRRDGQVKLRGYRIEVGEVEAALTAVPDVGAAVVSVRETADGKRLVAYVVPSPGASLTPSAVRAALQQALPAYMVPTSVVSLPELPLKANGKIDRDALPDPFDRKEPPQGAVPPRTAVEASLARLWADVLRLSTIGIHDNFFELGGDSILSIQIVSRALEAGFHLKPKHLFQYPTVAELACVVQVENGTAPDQTIVTGPVPLTPIQRWFLDDEPEDAHHFNQAVMLQLREGIEPDLVAGAVDQLPLRHDLLRARFHQSESGWRQDIEPPDDRSVVTRVDLSALPEPERRRAMLAACAEAQGSLNLASGPLFRAVLFDLGPDTRPRLLLVAHHLVIDGVSWRILADDLHRAHDRLARGETAPGDSKTTSFKTWAVALSNDAGQVSQEETSYWMNEAADALARRGADSPSPRVRSGSAARLGASLAAHETTALLRNLPQALDAHINEILLTGVAAAFERHGSSTCLRLDLEAHGRSDQFDRIDVSGTVGWFTTIFPVQVDLTNRDGLDTLTRVKRTLRGVPRNGIGHGELRYLGPSNVRQPLSAAGDPDVSFNYLGQFDQLVSESSPFEAAAESTGPVESPRIRRRHLIDIVAFVYGGEFRVEWTFDPKVHHRAVVEKLSAAFLDALRGLIKRAASAPQSLDSVEDSYPLTPMQQGMLFHTLLHPDDGIYSELFTCRLEGRLDIEAFKSAWSVVINRREILRSVFVWDGVPDPVQVVRRRADVPWTVLDWSDDEPDRQAERLRQLLQTEERRGFDLADGPLMRLTLVRLGAQDAQFVWTFHHILLDGWSMAIVFREIAETYDAVLERRPPRLGAAAPYGRYVRWLVRQPTDEAEAYWRATLGDVVAPTPLGIDRPAPESAVHAESREQTVRFSDTLTAEIAATAKANKITVNTMLLGAWAMALSRYSRQDDVVFGITVSGRPAALPGSESMVGLFINSVPVRLRVPRQTPVAGWLRDVQSAQAQQREHEHVPLVDITRCSGLAQGVPLFESILVFENYPIERVVDGTEHALVARGAESRHRSNFPLVLAASPGAQLSLRAIYDAKRFDDGAVSRLLDHLTIVLSGMAAAPEQPVRDLSRLVKVLGRKLTREPDRPARPLRALVRQERTPARTPIEARIAEIWREVLGVGPITVEDDFFELGGHSLLATKAASRLRQAFQIELPLVVLFEKPVLRDLAAEIQARTGSPAAPADLGLAPVSRQGNLPLSSAQQRLWFLDQLDPGSAAYNVPAALRLDGDLDGPALDRALTDIVRRHEVLRTTFDVVDGQPTQIAGDAPDFSLARVDLSQLEDHADRNAEALRLAAAEALTPFDLRHGPLLRGRLLRLAERQHVLLLTLHHIVCDAWSLRILVSELMALYEAHALGRTAHLEPLPFQYADFASWQRTWLEDPRIEGQLQRWMERLTACPTLDVPADRPRPAVQSYDGACHTSRLPHGLSEAIERLGRQEHATLFMTMLAGFQLLLSRYTGQTDVAVGTPVAVRPRKELEGLIGFFSNTLVMRSRMSGRATFRETLRQVRQVALEAYADQDVPFERVVEMVQPARHLDRHPLFQVLFTAQHAPVEALKLPGLRLRPLDIGRMKVRFDLELHVSETADGLMTAFYYSEDLFDRETVARMAAGLATLLHNIVTNPDCPVEDLELLPAEESRQLQAWNATERLVPRGPAIHQMFEAQVRRTPHAVAVEFHSERLTYAQLNARANQLARSLQALGVGPDDCVAIGVERGFFLTIAVLGVLKAGAAYVPLDASYPTARLTYMLADSRAKVLITQEHLLAELLGWEAGARPSTTVEPAVLCVDRDADTIASQREADLPTLAGPDHLAYVLYTSGSTGRPKGVAMPHQPLINLLLWQMDLSQERAAGRTLQYAPLSFDPSFLEMFSTWCAGGTLVLVEEELRRDFMALVRLIDARAVERLYITPAALHQLADAAESCGIVPKSLREVNAAGERLEVTPQIARLLGQIDGSVLFNQYGPTESHVVTVETLRAPAERWATLPSIGVALPNTRIHVLDRAGQQAPIGVPGELYIAGDCLARGYLNNPRLTAERFVPDPRSDRAGGRLYRTGDLARFLRSGAIEYLGRTDQQVKLRGYRVELGEVEAILTQYPAVLDAAAAVRESASGSRRLVAYVVRRGEGLDINDLLAHAARLLPEYMVPSIVEVLDALPMTPSGKVDRAALPAPAEAPEERYEAPRNDAELKMAAIWGDSLGVGRIGVNDNFFSAGGHSLLAAQVASRVRREWGVELPIRAIFESPTIAGLTDRLQTLLWIARGQVVGTTGVREDREEGQL